MVDENNALSGEQDAIAEQQVAEPTEQAPTADEPAAQANEEPKDAEQGEQPGDEAGKGEAKAEDDAAKADEVKEEAKPKRNRTSAKERISQLTQRSRDAERENARLKAQIERLEKLDRPDPNKYEDADEYSSDLAAYKVRKAQAEDLQEGAKDAETRANEALQQAYQERVADFAAETPDFHAVAFNQAVQISPTMAQEIMDSDLGPQVQYYLGKNPQEAAQIAAMPPGHQIRAIGRLEARVSAPAPKRVTQAPAPIKPVAGNRTPAAFDPNKASVEDYIKKRNEGWAG